MFNLKPIALVSGTVTCAVGFFLFIPLIAEIIYESESWQSYAVPILLYLIVGGSLVITNRNVIKTKNLVGEIGLYYVNHLYETTSYLPNLILPPPSSKNINFVT